MYISTNVSEYTSCHSLWDNIALKAKKMTENTYSKVKIQEPRNKYSKLNLTEKEIKLRVK